ncbi:hypothetical protein SKA34_10690 [Photobacterium sp. SKA34]|nr:hypothetical protein SKA34_10690 [Photobacterium sp. SKA34]
MQVTGGQVEAGRSDDGGLKISLLLPTTETIKK